MVIKLNSFCSCLFLLLAMLFFVENSRSCMHVRVFCYEFLVLSCLVSSECTLWEGFFWRMPKQLWWFLPVDLTP